MDLPDTPQMRDAARRALAHPPARSGVSFESIDLKQRGPTTSRNYKRKLKRKLSKEAKKAQAVTLKQKADLEDDSKKVASSMQNMQISEAESESSDSGE